MAESRWHVLVSGETCRVRVQEFWPVIEILTPFFQLPFFFFFFFFFFFGSVHCTFDIYVHHDIIRVFSFLWHSVMCNALCQTKSNLRGTYMSLPGEPMCAYVGYVWRSIIHLTLSGSEKSPMLCKVYKR